MKIIHWIFGVLFLLSAARGRTQGEILFQNSGAPTRLWSIDGPLAGPGVWGQLLAGPTTESLAPVGMPVEHRVTGLIFGGLVEVPTVDCNSLGYAQLLVWDGNLWGTALDGVPPDQLGNTDIVSLYMNCDPLPIAFPRFTQPAIVPIPEPSVIALMSLVALSLGIMSAWRNRLNSA